MARHTNVHIAVVPSRREQRERIKEGYFIDFFFWSPFAFLFLSRPPSSITKDNFYNHFLFTLRLVSVVVKDCVRSFVLSRTNRMTTNEKNQVSLPVLRYLSVIVHLDYTAFICIVSIWRMEKNDCLTDVLETH